MDLRANGLGTVFELVGGDPDGDNVMGVDLVDGDGGGEALAERVLPGADGPEGGEIGNEGGGTEAAQEAGEGVGGVAAEEEERQAEGSEAPAEVAEAAEHEAKLASVGAEEAVREAEGDSEWSIGSGSESGRVDEGPVVGGPLVAEHPVHDRAGGGGRAGLEDPDPIRVEGGGCGGGCDDGRCHLLVQTGSATTKIEEEDDAAEVKRRA